jgi:hypothetical protein
MENNFIELQALLTEREEMLAANLKRDRRGEALAYSESEFSSLAIKIRALKTAESPAIDYTAVLESAILKVAERHSPKMSDQFCKCLAVYLNSTIRASHNCV